MFFSAFARPLRVTFAETFVQDSISYEQANDASSKTVPIVISSSISVAADQL